MNPEASAAADPAVEEDPYRRQSNVSDAAEAMEDPYGGVPTAGTDVEDEEKEEEDVAAQNMVTKDAVNERSPVADNQASGGTQKSHRRRMSIEEVLQNLERVHSRFDEAGLEREEVPLRTSLEPPGSDEED